MKLEAYLPTPCPCHYSIRQGLKQELERPQLTWHCR
nr:MAG TPA: hypothetical protein [Caudoviricetes sp.]